ncbi:hypothetical protein [Draconibacterium sediminis]|uniref:DUF4760 domain-containing protein n=1 Tax=Draconibacterium sediminis TaxID=1544798 RepID=A0A0D8JCC8_9BACT|nr:hypothetical protein [Draconibacterium sediminis]KJF44640.1 hypothetical protein LH29_04035 [Draconibacterium sediminis]
MEVKDLLTTYWSQMTLVLLGIGYLIKRVLDIKLKKREINHDLFQRNRIGVVNRFFESYAQMELVWEHIAVYEILNRKYSTKEIDEIIFPSLNKLSNILFELKIYFAKSDMSNFEEVVEGMKKINSRLSELYFRHSKEDKVTEKANDFWIYRREVLKRNSELIEKLCINIRKTYGEYR